MLAVVAITLLINWNTSRMRVQATGLGGSKAQDGIASKGYVQFASGGRVMTAAAQQGASQCSSTYKTDTPTAQCQTFCNIKHKKFHCMWCKCRMCDFCAKGTEAIEEAAKAAPPPSPPPQPASPPLTLAAATAELEPEGADDSYEAAADDTNSSLSSDSSLSSIGVPLSSADAAVGATPVAATAAAAPNASVAAEAGATSAVSTAGGSSTASASVVAANASAPTTTTTASTTLAEPPAQQVQATVPQANATAAAPGLTTAVSSTPTSTVDGAAAAASLAGEKVLGADEPKGEAEMGLDGMGLDDATKTALGA